VVFALGTLHHELLFILEQQHVGPFTQYMERWAQAKPTSGWPSEVGVALHLADILISLLILALPWRRELLCLLAIPFLLSQLASPSKIASHNSVMAAGLALVLILGLAEWVERVIQRGQGRLRGTDWYGWTLTGLISVCTLTYLFAALLKLSPDVFWPAQSQVMDLMLPYARAAGMSTATALGLFGYPVIYGTILTELLLPILLLRERTRLLGCFLGLVFHLLMMGQGIVDFPTVILAFYPAFLSVNQARGWLKRSLAPPSPLRLASTLLLGAIGAVFISKADPTVALYAAAPDLDPNLVFAHSALMYVTFLATVHVTLVLGRWGLARQGMPRSLAQASKEGAAMSELKGS
jgi:hypothetical protein